MYSSLLYVFFFFTSVLYVQKCRFCVPFWMESDNSLRVLEVSFDCHCHFRRISKFLFQGNGPFYETVSTHSYTNCLRPYLCMKTLFMPRALAMAQACCPPAPPKHARTCWDVSWPLACDGTVRCQSIHMLLCCANKCTKNSRKDTCFNTLFRQTQWTFSQIASA